MTNNKLLIATRNPGKLREIKSILADLPIKIISLADIKYRQEIEEKGKTFQENAVVKATTVGKKTGLMALAEDSGLVIDALAGRPGVKSARYVEGSDEDRLNKVLDELKNIPQEKRTAIFRAVVAVYVPSSHPDPDVTSGEGSRAKLKHSSGILLRQLADQNDKIGTIYTFKGESKGLITSKPKGKNGFGYDPIFYNLDLEKTNGEASEEEKNRVSHRARALLKCKKFLLSSRWLKTYH